MDILEPWLAATIEGELGEALRHKEDGPNTHQSMGKSRGLSYDDGSNLRIPSPKKGPVVQITKFLTFEEPIQVTLSDSVIRVNASITNQASQQYAKKNRRTLTENTVGGLIQLHGFEIVATHLGPRDKRLTLYVKDFKSLGSNGSGNFGVAPQAIESREGTKELLNKLADLRRHGSDAHSEQSATASPMRSQPSTQTSEAGNNQDSQPGFATQVPRSNASIVNKPKPLDSTTSINIGSTSTANSAKSLAPPTKGKHGNLLASALSSLQVQAALQKPSANRLLGLLQDRKRAPPAPETISEPTIEQSPGRTVASIGVAVVERVYEASRGITLATGDDDASRAPNGSQKRKRQSPSNTPRKKAANDHGLHEIDKDCENLAVDHALENAAKFRPAVTEASLNTLHSRPASPSVSKSAKLNPKGPVEPSFDSVSKLTTLVSGQNSSRNRISSRDVNVPKDQETLLSRADSWLPAEPGEREPAANIPISILKTLNRKAKLLAQRPTKKRKRKNGTMTPSAAIDQRANSESDVPVSSGQWPSSPERDQLPPDSSSASAEHSDHSIHETSTKIGSLSSLRRQTHAMNPSHSMPPKRPSPIPARPLSIGSESPGREVVESGVDNELDNVDVSASMPPLFDRGSRTPINEGIVGRRSSTDSALRISLPSDTVPALAQSATLNPEETYIAKETFSPPLPASSTSESDLEMTVPLALNEETDLIASSAPMRRFPSSASQPQDPFTQVKRTPYVNGRGQNKSLSGSRTLSSPTKANSYPLTNGTTNDEVEIVSASVPSGPETSMAETHRESESANAVENQGIEKMAARLAEESYSEEVGDSILEKTDKLIAGVQQERRKAEAAADKTDHSSLIVIESQIHNSSLNQPSVVGKVNATVQAILETLPTPEDKITPPLPRLPKSDHADHMAHETKRKVADSSFVSPSVAKRQKRFKVPLAYTFAEKSEIPQDPSEGARQIRQNFLASRRSSESSTSTMSPTMSFNLLPGTISENPRDPSERARQIRQEFLASRRNSEASAPTMSPKLPFTPLPETIQPEQRNAEEEKKVGKVTVQDQLPHTEIEREKMAELKELSTRSQRQETESDAAPPPNGTASIGPDGDHAKPGAQDEPSFDYEADSLMFVAQNTDVQGPNAGLNTMVEASSYASNNETQRAQSVELVSSKSLLHQQANDDLVNAKDGADQDADPAIDMMGASHDQFANTDEDTGPVDPEPDKCRKDLPAGADEVADQESNASTPDIILDQAAEPGKAVESVHQQRSVEENAGAQTSDKITLDHTPQQKSLTMDADTPTPDEVATEPTAQQQLIGADIDPPTPDVQVDQDIMPLKPIAHKGEPTSQTNLLSFAVTAFIAKSNAEKQPHLSSAAVGPAIPQSDPVSDPEVNPVGERQNIVQLPLEIAKHVPPSVPQNLFDKFKATYPAYPGDLKHFAAICRKISQLVKANRMEHQSLWDDFIVRHKIEYSQYLQRCAEEAEDAVPYEDFYQTEIEEPQYQKRVINRRNLDDALALVAQKPSIEKVHDELVKDNDPQVENKSASKSEPSDETVHVEPVKDDGPRVEPVEHKSTPELDSAIEKMHDDHAPANDDQPLESIVRKPSESRVTVDTSAERVHSDVVRHNEPRSEPIKAKSACQEAISTRIVEKLSETRVTIDLTEDDSSDEQPKTAKVRGLPAQSNVPHMVNGVLVEPPLLQYRRDNSDSLYQVPYTPPIMRSSHAPPPPQSMGSPLLPATASTKSRSLPWKEFDHSAFQNSPNAIASDSPIRIPGSELREGRAKRSSKAPSQLLAKSTPKSSKQSQGLLNTCHKVIQSNWGLKVHELLEPEYYSGQVLSETMIELLAEIASKVNVHEARNRIKEAVDTRIRDNVRGGAGHPSQDRKMLKSDLEVVRGDVETSSMSTTSPFSLPHTNAAVEKQDEGTPSKWWDDDNSPFKSFARAYTSIRHGNGNSFAKADPAEPGDAEKVHEAGSSGVELKKIDIMRWNL